MGNVVIACGLPHDVEGSGSAGPSFETERPLLDEDFEAVDRLRSTALRLLHQRGAARPVDEVDHARVLPEGIGAQGQILERGKRIG
jgi:hypothetical protein